MTTSADTSSIPSTAPPVAIHRILAGQKALVTGANSGIGKGVAIALGEAGADVVVNYVDGDDAANAVVEEIRKSGVKAYAHKADVSSDSTPGISLTTASTKTAAGNSPPDST